jgi:hypothetical protein
MENDKDTVRLVVLLPATAPTTTSCTTGSEPCCTLN